MSIDLSAFGPDPSASSPPSLETKRPGRVDLSAFGPSPSPSPTPKQTSVGRVDLSAFGPGPKNKKPFETAHKPASKQDVTPNPLRAIADAFSTSLALKNAWLRGDSKDDFSWAGDLPKALDLLRHGKVSDLQEQYGPGSASELQYGVTHNDPISKARQQYPALNAAATFGESFFAPENIVTGEVLGRGIGAARAASPFVDETFGALGHATSRFTAPVGEAARAIRGPIAQGAAAVAKRTGAAGLANAITQTGQTLFSRYAPLAHAGGKEYAEQGLRIDKAPHVAEAATERLADRIFKDADGHPLTHEQKMEIVNRSYRSSRGTRVDRPGASGKVGRTGYGKDSKPIVPYERKDVLEPKGMSLDQRADLYRASWNNITSLQKRFDLLDTEFGGAHVTNEGTGMYDPREAYGDRPIYTSQDAANADGMALPVQPHGSISRAGAGKLAVPVSGKHARLEDNRDPLYLLGDKLSPDFDPAHQFVRAYGRRRVALANELRRRELEDVYPLNKDGSNAVVTTDYEGGPKVAYPARAEFVVGPADGPQFGYGSEGLKNRAKMIAEQADAIAHTRALETPYVKGLVDNTALTSDSIVKSRAMNARIRAAQATARETAVTTKSAEQFQQRIEAQFSRMRGRVGDELLRNVNGMASRVTKLNQGIEEMERQIAQGAGQARAKQLARMVKERDYHVAHLERIAERVERDASYAGTPANAIGRIDEIASSVRGIPIPDVEAAKSKAKALRKVKSLAARAVKAPSEASAAATDGHLKKIVDTMGKVANAGVDQSAVRAMTKAKRISEDAEAQVAKESESLYKRRDRIVAPGERLVEKAEGEVAWRRVKQKMAGENVERLKAEREAIKAYNRIYERAYDDAVKALEEAWGGTRAPEGYRLESDLKLGSPTSPSKVLHEPIFEFYKSQERGGGLTGSNKDVKGFLKTLDLLNTLARASIVWWPTVHGVNNLGMAFLAERGSPQRMGEILRGKYVAPSDVVLRAEQAGATAPQSRVFFGKEGAHERYAPTDQLVAEAAAEHGKLAGAATRAQKFLSRDLRIGGQNYSYDGLNSWLFDKVERGYRLDYFDRLTRLEGMTDGAAARKVNETFGKVGDLSPMERAMQLNRIFYFYTWMKTAVPYWTKKGILDPKWWDAPVQAIKVNNEQQGYDDPSRPFTFTAGRRANGDVRRMILPVPQRASEMIAATARIPFDAAHGDFAQAREDLHAPMNYLTGHFSLPLSVARDAYDAAAGHAPPFNIFASDKHAPPLEQAGGMASKLAGKFLSPIGIGERAISDPAAVLGGFQLGMFTYSVAPKEKQKEQHRLRQHYGKKINAAIARGDTAAAQRDKAELDQKLTALDSRKF